MGTLTYDVVKQIHFDDRLLAHLQLVIATKLRRGESFNFSWKTDPSEGSGRTTIWLHPAIPLLYEFQGSRQPSINRVWLDELMASADSVTGLQVIPEPREDRPRRQDDEPLRASSLQ
ncbi:MULTISPECIES: DUF7882 family protein [unclassified Leifsonia]|uniref:DUF7882 family protein n=1 Tax=unclassified Leifsonia TaxID=2663824 RepID=UPI0006F60ECD|nr:MULTISPECIES: hypothetical protein [unclassified Leifsonia]KQX06919.1 ATP-dependent DNA ligase [Leifsonia sp. Root1293]KRA12691.1 ATP-dependent DNA ligase [Leifsonia sp. Root60]